MGKRNLEPFVTLKWSIGAATKFALTNAEIPQCDMDNPLTKSRSGILFSSWTKLVSSLVFAFLIKCISIYDYQYCIDYTLNRIYIFILCPIWSTTRWMKYVVNTSQLKICITFKDISCRNITCIEKLLDLSMFCVHIK